MTRYSIRYTDIKVILQPTPLKKLAVLKDIKYSTAVLSTLKAR